MEPAKQLFDSLSKWKDLKRLIETGEAEGLYLECKSPQSPQLSIDIKAHLAKALSGFSNTEGGVIIWGIATKRHSHSGLDVLTELEPIGLCAQFAKQVETAVPLLTTPPITKIEIKYIVPKRGEKKGVVILFVPKIVSDPAQMVADGSFWFRSGAEFTRAPYEMIKRLFAATESPELSAFVDIDHAKILPNGDWIFPLAIENLSSAVARDVTIFIGIDNPSDCEKISCPSFSDVSSINRGEKLFSHNHGGVFHRGMNVIVSQIHVTMAAGRNSLRMTIKLYADKMRAKFLTLNLKVNNGAFEMTIAGRGDIY